MTNKNKIPVVGKRYYPKYPAPYYSAVFRDSFTHGDQLLYRFDCIYKDSGKAGYFSIPIEKFFEYFEELPDQPQANKEVKVNSIEEAVEELKKQIKDLKESGFCTEASMERAVLKLINSLAKKAQIIPAIENFRASHEQLQRDVEEIKGKIK